MSRRFFDTIRSKVEEIVDFQRSLHRVTAGAFAIDRAKCSEFRLADKENHTRLASRSAACIGKPLVADC